MSPATTRLKQLRERLRLWKFEQRAGAFERRARAVGRTRRDKPPHALVLTAADVGSLGDEAMLLAAGHALRSRGSERLTLISYGGGESWQPHGDYTGALDLGERYFTEFWDTAAEFLDQCRDADRFLILGADMMDGYYNPWECLRRAALARVALAAGLATTIGGFSFNPTPHPWTVAALGALPPAIRLVARDPVSWRRLDQQLPRPVDLGADLAFLLEPETGDDALADWLAAERAAGHLLLGVNVNYLAAPGSRDGDVGPELCASFARELTTFLARHPHARLVFLPHDYRRMAGRYDDLELLQRIHGQMPAAAAAAVRVVDAPLGAAAIKRICGALDLVLTGRMHLAIAALGRGVPAGGVAYQGKFEGLYEHFALADMTLAPEKLHEPGAIAGFLSGLVERRDVLTVSVAERLPRVRDLAMINFTRDQDVPEARP